MNIREIKLQERKLETIILSSLKPKHSRALILASNNLNLTVLELVSYLLSESIEAIDEIRSEEKEQEKDDIKLCRYKELKRL